VKCCAFADDLDLGLHTVLGVTYVIAFVTLSGVINAQVHQLLPQPSVPPDVMLDMSAQGKWSSPMPSYHCTDAALNMSCFDLAQAWDIKTQLKAEIRQDLLDSEMRIKCASPDAACMFPVMHTAVLSTCITYSPPGVQGRDSCHAAALM
jgi:hypothetical protein